jgi:hypothetical protein
LADPCRAPEGVPVPMALDGVKHAKGLRDGPWVVVAPQEPQTPAPVHVHELAKR